MKRLLLLLALLAVPLAAQDQKKDEPAGKPEVRVQRLFVLKYAEPSQIANLIRVFAPTVTPNSEMHALAVSATPEAMVAIEDAIKRLDVSSSTPQNIELSVYLLVGSQTDSASGPLPKDLDPVVAQLKNAFAYKGYRLMDALALRARTGQRANTTSQGGTIQFPLDGSTKAVTTNFEIASSSLGSDGTIHIERMNTTARPANSGTTLFSIGTDLDIKEGQRLVVGKAGLSSTEAMFLVLMAHVAQ